MKLIDIHDTGRSIYFWMIKCKNILKNIFFKSLYRKYVFVLCPAHTGSTILTELLSTSKNVSSVNNKGTKEGQTLPSVRKMMFDHHDGMNINRKFDWDFIKKEWLKYWDLSKPLLLEKSPSNIVRACDIQKTFKPAYFVCMVRTPYAKLETVKRTHSSLKDFAEIIIKEISYQKQNIEKLENVLYFTYEELTDNPENVKKSLIKFLPELEDIDTNFTSTSHNFKNKPLKITNLNAEKISKLNQEDLDKINSVLSKHKNLLSFFGYELIQEPINF